MDTETIFLAILATVLLCIIIAISLHNLHLEREKHDLQVEFSRNIEIYKNRLLKAGYDENGDQLDDEPAFTDLHLQAYQEEMRDLRRLLHESELAREELEQNQNDHDIQQQKKDLEMNELHGKKQLNETMNKLNLIDDAAIQHKDDEITRLSTIIDKNIEEINNLKIQLKDYITTKQRLQDTRIEKEKIESRYKEEKENQDIKFKNLKQQLLETEKHFDLDGTVIQLREELFIQEEKFNKYKEKYNEKMDSLQSRMNIKTAKTKSLKRSLEDKIKDKDSKIKQLLIQIESLTKVKDEIEIHQKEFKQTLLSGEQTFDQIKEDVKKNHVEQLEQIKLQLTTKDKTLDKIKKSYKILKNDYKNDLNNKDKQIKLLKKQLKSKDPQKLITKDISEQRDKVNKLKKLTTLKS